MSIFDIYVPLVVIISRIFGWGKVYLKNTTRAELDKMWR